MNVYAKDTKGIWHQTRATYPVQADTVCGRRVDARHFATKPEDRDLRPEYCADCERAAEAKRTPREPDPGYMPPPQPAFDTADLVQTFAPDPTPDPSPPDTSSDFGGGDFGGGGASGDWGSDP